jgi:hypothetical protein
MTTQTKMAKVNRPMNEFGAAETIGKLDANHFVLYFGIKQ